MEWFRRRQQVADPQQEAEETRQVREGVNAQVAETEPETEEVPEEESYDEVFQVAIAVVGSYRKVRDVGGWIMVQVPSQTWWEFDRTVREFTG